MNDTYTEIRGDTTCAICKEKRRCKRTADGSKIVCFRESAEKVNGFKRVKLTDGVATYVLDDGRSATNGTSTKASNVNSHKASNHRPDGRVKPTHATREAAIEAARKSTGGKLAGEWQYTDDFYVLRFDTADGKEFRPLSRDKTGWKVKDPPGPLPLYRAANLHDVVKIYIVEGEKCADAACEIGLTAITSAHGAKSAAKTNWKPLDGVAEIVILPDADDDGRQYAYAVCRALAEKLDKPPAIKSVKLPGLPPKGDIIQFIEARDSQTNESIVAEIEALVAATPTIDLEYQAGGLHVVTADTIEPKPVAWLWPSRIPLGKLTVIAGDPKVGKSVLAVDLAARVSTGSRWPDQITTYNTARKVIVFSAEDDAADTIVPRLIAAEADLACVLICHGVKNVEGPGDVPFTIDAHLRQLERLLKRTSNVGLITIDPISAFIGGKVDSHNNSDIRGLLAPLAKLAADHGVAVVLITHLNKGGGGKAIYRTMGSLAFTAAARAVWLVTKDKDSDRVLMLNAGMNLARCPGGLAYSIEDRDGLPVLAWESGPVEMDADDALAAEQTGANERQTAIEKAVEFVQDKLRAGPMPTKALDAAADAVGISTPTLKRAKSQLGITATQERADGKVAAWVVSLGQSQGALTAIDDLVDTVDPLDLLDGEAQNRVLPSEQGDQGDQGDQRKLGGPVGKLSENGPPAVDQEADRA